MPDPSEQMVAEKFVGAVMVRSLGSAVGRFVPQLVGWGT